MMQERLLTLPQFSREFGVSIWLTREAAKKGEIPTVRIGRRHRIPMSAVQVWLARSAEKKQIAAA